MAGLREGCIVDPMDVGIVAMVGSSGLTPQEVGRAGLIE